jgi:hypothetical protein
MQKLFLIITLCFFSTHLSALSDTLLLESSDSFSAVVEDDLKKNMITPRSANTISNDYQASSVSEPDLTTANDLKIFANIRAAADLSKPLNDSEQKTKIDSALYFLEKLKLSILATAGVIAATSVLVEAINSLVLKLRQAREVY